MEQQIPKGLATWAGIIAAAGQYAASVAVFLNDPDKAVALGPLATATATLVAVIVGRMQQAKAKTEQAVARSLEVAATANVVAYTGAAGSSSQAGEFEREPADNGRDLHENGLT